MTYWPFKRLTQVRQVIWSQDDSKIISCGMDGAVYEWNVANFKREGESVLKSCSYTSVSVSPDGRTTFAVGSDKTLKEICDSQVRLIWVTPSITSDYFTFIGRKIIELLTHFMILTVTTGHSRFMDPRYFARGRHQNRGSVNLLFPPVTVSK